jgi:hypothetical protein
MMQRKLESIFKGDHGQARKEAFVVSLNANKMPF